MDENGGIDLSALQDMIKTAVTEQLTNAANSGVLVEIGFQAIVEVSDREYLQTLDLIMCDAIKQNELELTSIDFEI